MDKQSPEVTGGLVAPLVFKTSADVSGKDAKTLVNAGDSGDSGPGRPDALCPALCPFRAETGPDLAQVITAWPGLPPAIRAGVMALVNAGQTAQENLSGAAPCGLAGEPAKTRKAGRTGGKA